MNDLSDHDAAIDALKAELQGIGQLGCATLLSGFCFLGFVQTWISATQWLCQAGLLWGIVCWQTLKRLSLNRPDPEAPLYATLGPGNRVTLLRGA